MVTDVDKTRLQLEAELAAAHQELAALKQQTQAEHSSSVVAAQVQDESSVCRTDNQNDFLLRQVNRDLQYYKGIVSSTPDLIALVDSHYVFRVVNDSYLKAFGCQSREIIDRPVAELFGEEDFERTIRPHLIDAFNGETVRYERWITLPSDGRRLCDITFHPVPEPEGPIRHVAANIRDITEGKQAMVDRQRIFEASFDMLCFIGIDGCFKDLNPSWTRTLGWSVTELINTPWLDLVHPQDRRIAVEGEERLLLRQQSSASEYRLRCKDGRYRWIAWNASVDLERQEIFATIRDITDNKLMQEALKSSVRKYRTFLIRLVTRSSFTTFPSDCWMSTG